MTKKEKVRFLITELKKRYPKAECALEYNEGYQLMIAGRLSAQCTDKRVNIVTKELFSKYPDLKSLADADIAEVEEIIRPCGLFHTKARNIIDMCSVLYYDLGGVIPDTIEELTKLPGIGRKTANLIMGDVHGKEAYVCDTHCIRITNRLGLTDSKAPEKVEAQLRKIVPPKESSDLCHRIVFFGRDVCSAARPRCSECELFPICNEKSNNNQADSETL